MRWLLVLLIAGNLGYFVYNSWFIPEESAPADDRRSPSSGEKIQLLGEAIASGDAVKIESADRREVKAKISEKLLCTQIGAFQAKETAEQVRQRLMAASIGSDIKEVKVPSSPDFWVYIPPLESRAAAIRKLKELQSNQIDSFVITEGELANGISLGLFTRKHLAEQLYARRRASGYNAQLSEVERFRDEYWVEVRREDRELLSNELWDGIHSRYGFAERFDNLCDSTIARPGEFQ